MTTTFAQQMNLAQGGTFSGAGYGSTGTITLVDGSLLLDGDRFRLKSLRDASQVVFSFVNMTNRRRPLPQESTFSRNILYFEDDTIETIAGRVILAINRVRVLALFASQHEDANTVTLTHALGGTKTNYDHPDDEVSDEGFVVSGMAGGRQMPFLSNVDGIAHFDDEAGACGEFSPWLGPVDGYARPQLVSVGPVFMSLGDSTSWTLSAVSPDGSTRTLATAASGGYVGLFTPYTLTGDERLRLTATGGTEPAGRWARVYSTPVR